MRVQKERHFDRDGEEHHLSLSAHLSTQNPNTSSNILQRLPPGDREQIDAILTLALEAVAAVCTKAALRRRRERRHRA